MPTIIGRDENPSASKLQSLIDALQQREPDSTTWDFLAFYILPRLSDGEAQRLRWCFNEIDRYSNEAHGAHELLPKRCRSRWCPRCVRGDYIKRARLAIDRLRSVSPDKPPQLLAYHIVMEPPKELHPLMLHDPEDGLHAFREACWEAIGRTFDIPDNGNLDLFMREVGSQLGAVCHLHPWGDDATPWPTYFPHYDMLMPAYRRLVKSGAEGLEAKDPAKYRLEEIEEFPRFKNRTRRYFAQALRRRFRPILGKMPLSPAVVEAHHALEADELGIFHLSLIDKKTGRYQAKEGEVANKAFYSARPLYDPGLSRLHRDDEGLRSIFSYTPQGGRIRHVGAPAAVAERLLRLRDYIGGALGTVRLGYMSPYAYATTARAAGNIPVESRPKTARKLLETYRRDPITKRWDVHNPVRHHKKRPEPDLTGPNHLGNPSDHNAEA